MRDPRHNPKLGDVVKRGGGRRKMQHDEAIRVFDRYLGLPTDVRRAFNRILDDHNIERTGRMELIAERDQLRAELAAAKERGDGLYLGLRQTLEALGGVAQPGVSEAFLILGVPGEAAAIKRLNNTLAADNARLRKALELAKSLRTATWTGTAHVAAQAGHDFDDCWCIMCNGYRKELNDVSDAINNALAATPAQSLAAHDAAVKVAALDEKASVSADRAWIDGARFGWNCGVLESRNDLDAAIESRRKQISEADRMEKEAPHG